MIRLPPIPVPRTIAAIGASLCFLIASFLCGCVELRDCHFWAPEAGDYQFIFASEDTANFISVTTHSEGGPTFVHSSQANCDKLLSFRKLN